MERPPKSPEYLYWQNLKSNTFPASNGIIIQYLRGSGKAMAKCQRLNNKIPSYVVKDIKIRYADAEYNL